MIYTIGTVADILALLFFFFFYLFKDISFLALPVGQ